MAKITKAEAEQKARDFVATFESKQACWDYLKSLGVFWGMSDETATNDELAMAVLIEEYLYGLDPSLAKTTGHYISKARMDILGTPATLKSFPKTNLTKWFATEKLFCTSETF